MPVQPEKFNKERVLAVADAIEKAYNKTVKAEIGFNMCAIFDKGADDHFLYDMSGNACSTVACIAGWTVFMFDPDSLVPDRNGVFHDILGRAAKLLGMERSTAQLLFVPRIELPLSEITVPDAVATLRRLAETGEVDWGKLEDWEDGEPL